MSNFFGGIIDALIRNSVDNGKSIKDRIIFRTQVDKYVVSTIDVYDVPEGHETAIIADTVYPVERFSNRKDAEKIHNKWVQFLKDGNRAITVLGHEGYGVENWETTI